MTSLTDLLPAGAVLHVSAQADNKVLSLAGGAWSEFGLPGPRGIAVGPDGTAVATDAGIVHFTPDGRKACTTHLTGLQAHELVCGGDGGLYVAAAAHSSIYRVDLRGNLEHVVTPDGTDIGTDDARAYLNGIATRDGAIAYVTALGLSNTANGWRDEAAQSRGAVIDADTGRVVLGGLLMPHTPRLHNGQLFVLNSGHGQVIRWTPGDATAAVVSTLHGFCRGLLVIGDHAIIGVSQGRLTAVPNLTVDALAQPGLAVVDLNSGAQTDFVALDVTEVFDVVLGTALLAE